MEQERVLGVCLLTALLTLTIVIAGCASNTSNHSTSTVPTQRSENVTMTTTTNATNNVTRGEPITVVQGLDFTITLRSNPSTGYHWEPQFDNATLTLTNSVFISDPNPYNLVGVPGSQVFTFQGLVKGMTTITFLNVSPSQIVTEQAVYPVTVT